MIWEIAGGIVLGGLILHGIFSGWIWLLVIGLAAVAALVAMAAFGWWAVTTGSIWGSLVFVAILFVAGKILDRIDPPVDWAKMAGGQRRDAP